MEFVAMLLFELHPHLLNSLRDYVARPSSQRGTVTIAAVGGDRMRISYSICHSECNEESDLFWLEVHKKYFFVTKHFFVIL